MRTICYQTVEDEDGLKFYQTFGLSAGFLINHILGQCLKLKQDFAPIDKTMLTSIMSARTLSRIVEDFVDFQLIIEENGMYRINWLNIEIAITLWGLSGNHKPYTKKDMQLFWERIRLVSTSNNMCDFYNLESFEREFPLVVSRKLGETTVEGYIVQSGVLGVELEGEERPTWYKAWRDGIIELLAGAFYWGGINNSGQPQKRDDKIALAVQLLSIIPREDAHEVETMAETRFRHAIEPIAIEWIEQVKKLHPEKTDEVLAGDFSRHFELALRAHLIGSGLNLPGDTTKMKAMMSRNINFRRKYSEVEIGGGIPDADTPPKTQELTQAELAERERNQQLDMFEL